MSGQFCTVRDLDLTHVRPDRAGVILYHQAGDQLVFGFGVHSEEGHRELTDFGGRVEYRTRDPTVIDGALREFSEESLGVFGHLGFIQIRDCLAVYDRKNLIIFLRVDQSPQRISQLFNEKYLAARVEASATGGPVPEVSGIQWISEDGFRTAVRHKKYIYDRVANFLNEIEGDFLSEL